MSKIAGIDWSLSSPAITIIDNGVVTSYAFFDTKKQEKLFSGNYTDKVHLSAYPEYKTYSERYDKLTDWAMGVLQGIDFALFEDYAFSASGKITAIAECCGIMKHKMYIAGIKFEVITPTSLKLFGAGAGNAKKQAMLDSFTAREYDIIKLFDANIAAKKIASPIDDICDSYWLARKAEDMLK